MSDMLVFAGAILSLLGTFFFLLSGIGIVRLPDFYSRLHGPTKAATLGLVLLALGSLVGEWGSPARTTLHWLEDFLLIAVVFFTVPVSAQVLTKSARRRRIDGADER
ncbi:MAG: monovalent cation/H(+) antiporter subunit G [Candidatus Eisenbacteria bacterium]|uniref:Monovalent cation/H(+) antiporter subunit G n=1 Tax=Eiseniibacteriota bacterium TaxID=2212470 RepID=A0A956NJ76_UNCEI|nr:monovalent cation/H(+) antiporter subunit G [Candidatus Eisenbacteria bacterium]